MTSLLALDRIVSCLDCLSEWDRLVEDLSDSELADVLDVDRIGRSVCLLDAAARLALRDIERTLVGEP